MVNASASSHQENLLPQQPRTSLLAKSEHAPPGISQRSSPPPTQLLLSRSRPQVLAAGDPQGYQGGVLPRCPILYAVSFCTDDGFGIEMVRSLDEAHSVDIVQALESGAVAKVVPETSLDEKNKHRLLWDWMDALEQTMTIEVGPASPDPLTLGDSEDEHPGG